MEERRDLERRELVDKYFPYVKKIVIGMGRSLPPGLEVNDLINSAVIGLILAAKKFDPERNIKFETFARNRIRGEIIEAFRNHDKLNRRSRTLLKTYEKQKRILENNMQSSVESELVMDIMKLSEREKFLLRTLIEPDAALMNEFKVEPYFEDEFIKKIDKYQFMNENLKIAIEKLDDKEKKIINDYYIEDEKTMKQIGSELNLTESRISQIHSQLIKKLRKEVNNINKKERAL